MRSAEQGVEPRFEIRRSIVVRVSCVRGVCRGRCVLRCRVAASRRDATSTVNGSPVRRAPTLHPDVGQAGVRQQRCQLVVVEAEPAIAEPVAHPRLVVLAQVEHQHAAARARGCAPPPRSARAGIVRRDAAPATAARRRRWRRESAASRARRASSRRSTRGAARASARARFEHVGRAIDGDHPRRPAARLDRQIAFAAAEIGDVERRQQVAERARPRGPAPARHELPLARVRAGVRRRSSPCAAAALLPAARRRRGQPRSSRRRVELRLRAAATAARCRSRRRAAPARAR